MPLHGLIAELVKVRIHFGQKRLEFVGQHRVAGCLKTWATYSSAHSNMCAPCFMWAIVSVVVMRSVVGACKLGCTGGYCVVAALCGNPASVRYTE